MSSEVVFYNLKRFLLCALLAILITLPGAAWGLDNLKTVLPNGLTVVTAPNNFSDLVAVEILVKASIADEPSEQIGLRYVVQRLLVPQLEGNAVAQSWEGQIGGETALDYVELHTICTSENFEKAVSGLAQTMRQPTFSEEGIGQVKRQLALYRNNDFQDPLQEDYAAFRAAWYGDFPYGRRVEGYDATRAALTQPVLQRFYDNYFLPNNMIIAVAGNVGPERARRVISQDFKDWPPKPIRKVEMTAFAPPTASRLIVDEDSATQNAHILMGFAAPPAGNDEAFAAFQVIYALLSKRSGRINTSLRDKLGLAYDVNSFYLTLKYPSHFCISIVCRPEQAEEAKEAVSGELERLRQEPVSAPELAGAKAFLLGQHLVSRQRNLQQAYLLAWYEFLGLGVGFEQQYPILINDVTADEVQRTAQKYLTTAGIVLRLPE